MRAHSPISRLLVRDRAERERMARVTGEWLAQRESTTRCPICDTEPRAESTKQRLNMWMLHRSLYGWRRRCARGY